MIKYRKLILIRTLETFAVGIILSVLATILSYVFEGNYSAIIKTTIVIDLIFFAVCYVLLKKFRFDVPGLKTFYTINLIAMGIYCAVVVAFAAFIHFSGEATRDVLGYIYTYCFFNFKTFRFISYSQTTLIGLTQSALIYSGVCMLFVLVSPVFIRKREKLAKDFVEGR